MTGVKRAANRGRGFTSTEIDFQLMRMLGAANAAQELRTPLAAAIAQAQLLQTETADTAARTRAADIEATLKRLTRVSERLMQLARAEGGQLRRNHETDLRPVAHIITQDLARGGGFAASLRLPVSQSTASSHAIGLPDEQATQPR